MALDSKLCCTVLPNTADGTTEASRCGMMDAAEVQAAGRAFRALEAAANDTSSQPSANGSPAGGASDDCVSESRTPRVACLAFRKDQASLTVHRHGPAAPSTYAAINVLQLELLCCNGGLRSPGLFLGSAKEAAPQAF